MLIYYLRRTKPSYNRVIMERFTPHKRPDVIDLPYPKGPLAHFWEGGEAGGGRKFNIIFC